MDFKEGDMVKILPHATSVGVESEDVGKVGVIDKIWDDRGKHYGIEVQMGEICEARGYVPKWNIGYEMIELSPRKNEQLMFSFMKD